MVKDFCFSDRTSWSLNVNALSQELRSLKEKGVSVLDLTESNPTRCGFRYPSDKILAALADPLNLSYSPVALGNSEARSAISRYYARKGFEVDPGRIVLTASTSESYSFLFRLLLNPTESVLVGQPSYPLFEFLIELNDAKMDSYHLRYSWESRWWAVDVPSIQNAVHPATKAFVLVNPNNPTGSLISWDEMTSINQVCLEHNIALISDEVFNDYVFGTHSDRVLSVVGNKDVLSFSLGGISKCMGLPQMKLGWIVVSGPRKTVESAIARLEVIADTYLSVNTPVQNALGHWLEFQEDIVGEIQSRLKTNWIFLQDLLSASGEDGLQLLNSQGGWYAVLKLPSGRGTEEEWVLEFLRKDHVWVHPGYFFDFQEEPFIVLSLLPETAIFQQGLGRILNRVSPK